MGQLDQRSSQNQSQKDMMMNGMNLGGPSLGPGKPGGASIGPGKPGGMGPSGPMMGGRY
jgi:hypothetical protein